MASKKSIKENKKLSINDNGYFKVSLDTFLYNAGIVGFIQVLEEAEASKGKNKEEVKNDIKDYYYEGQDLYVSKKFLKKSDLSQLYIYSMIKKFGDKSTISETFKNIDYLISKEGIEEKEFNSKINSIIDSLSSNSIKTGCETLQSNGLKIKIQENINNIKKNKKDIDKIKKYLKEIQNNYRNKEVKQTLLMKNIMYAKIQPFWSNKAFLNPQKSKKDLKNEFYETFEKPLKSIIEETKGKYNCITCGMQTSSSMDTTFLFEVGVDTGRKKSAFWNCNPDSFICPICSFIYACSPLGFRDIGNLMFFINQNDSIKTLISMNVAGRIIDEKEDAHYIAYNTIINKALDEKMKELNSIQVIIRNKNGYSFNTIGHDTLKIIKSIKGELEVISKSYLIIPKDNRFDIYKICLENILNFRNQCNLIYLLLMNFEKDGEKGYTINYTVKTIFTILKIQIKQNHIFREDINMNDKINLSYIACKSGDEMRRIIIGVNNDRNLLDKEEKEADNKLRGLVYQLINSIHTSNRDLFLSNITRLYTSMNLTIPNVFTKIFERDEDFKEIGYAYVLGLKGAYYNNKEKENKKEEGE
ncbi:Cas8a1 family CRISPR/Cas system-associated protein [uncultured Brachyspira sp.]|uniref:Cas8a1 family CRISPR/Cas system-associated protein n=1 Tax=uncultured Brachyspira sp. TaxID=221953 RepID=UPI00259B02B2|nr:Cas8a1 family CRISPR/Cas system-associated protein [uncultured Brachyspira sp.]